MIWGAGSWKHLKRAYAAASTASATGPGTAAATRRIAAPPTGEDRQPSSAASSAVSTACGKPLNPQWPTQPSALRLLNSGAAQVSRGALCCQSAAL